MVQFQKPKKVGVKGSQCDDFCNIALLQGTVKYNAFSGMLFW